MHSALLPEVLMKPELRDEDALPTFIYSYNYRTDKLWRTHLVTGTRSIHQVPSYKFKYGCCWSELPEDCLLITGGGPPEVKEVARIDILREFAVTQQPPMLTPRRSHACVYHAQHLYALGGLSDTGSSWLKDCERYVCAERRWEALPPLPKAAGNISGVVVGGSLYALGGLDEGKSFLDLIQQLTLTDLTWKVMELRLPHIGCGIPCFKLSDSEVYLVINKTLYSFTPLQILPLKTLLDDMQTFFGASYYSRGTLYCANQAGSASRMEIGLTSSL
jgi:hypothetical protein